MTTARILPETRSVEEQALLIVGERPEEAIQLVASYHERMRKEETALASVRLTENGIECDNALGLWRVAQLYASSQMLPEHLQGQPQDCMVLMQLSQRLKIDFFMLAQSCYIVHGKPGLEAKLAIALLNNSGSIDGRVKYDFTTGEDRTHKNDDFGCRAIVVDKASGEKIEGPWIKWKMVKAEGWLSKKGSKWATMPEQMFRYRSAVFLIRAHYPEVMLGFPTVEENHDVGPPVNDAVVVAADVLTPKIEREPVDDAVRPFPTADAAVQDINRTGTRKPPKPPAKADGDGFPAELTEQDIQVLEQQIDGSPTTEHYNTIVDRLAGLHHHRRIRESELDQLLKRIGDRSKERGIKPPPSLPDKYLDNENVAPDSSGPPEPVDKPDRFDEFAASLAGAKTQADCDSVLAAALFAKGTGSLTPKGYDELVRVRRELRSAAQASPDNQTDQPSE